MRTLWRNALLMTMDDARLSAVVTGDLLIDGDTIVAVGPGAGAGQQEGPATGEAPCTIVDATGLMIIPGLVNAHTHSWETLLRGTSERLPLELWMLETYPVEGVLAVPPRLVYLRSLVAALDALRGGTTSVLDDVGELPLQTPESLAAVFDAYDDAGIRATCTGGVADVAYVDRLPRASTSLTREAVAASRAAMPTSRAVIDAYLDFSELAFATHHGRAGRLSYAVAPSAPQRSTDELLVAAADLAARHDAVLHLHLLETRLQAAVGRERYGRTIVEHLDRLGLLTEHTALAHAIWLSEGDVQLLGSRPGTIIHNPVSNLKLGSGVFPWRALQSAGATVALGTDGTASNDSLRMLDTIKTAALMHSVADHRADSSVWPSTGEVLLAATRGGAAALNQSAAVGSLEPGKRADFVVIDLSLTTNFTPLNDAARQLVFSEDGSSITEVWVAGECVMRGGRSTRIDERPMLAEFRELAAEYLVGHRATVAANRRHAATIGRVLDQIRQADWPEEKGLS